MSRLLSVLIAGAAAFQQADPRPPKPLAHYYYVDDPAAWLSLERNIDCVGLLSPVWFFVQADGEVRTEIDARVRELALSRGVRLMPVVMNEDFRPEIAAAVLGSQQARDLLVEKLRQIAIAERLAGYQLDFENMEASQREGYAQLAERLGKELRKEGMQLSVAVVAPVYSIGPVESKARNWEPTPRSAAFDYASLGRAADFLTLMAYDQYATPDTPGPIAGLDWVEACIRKTLEFVPARKITLGLPLYHRHWAGAKVTTGSWADAKYEANRANAPAQVDAVHEEPVIRYETEGTPHVIWFHDARSLGRRMELVRKYRLRGFSAWRVGQEDPAIWLELGKR
jgi:spore germination protein YaaH